MPSRKIRSSLSELPFFLGLPIIDKRNANFSPYLSFSSNAFLSKPTITSPFITVTGTTRLFVNFMRLSRAWGSEETSISWKTIPFCERNSFTLWQNTQVFVVNTVTFFILCTSHFQFLYTFLQQRGIPFLPTHFSLPHL